MSAQASGAAARGAEAPDGQLAGVLGSSPVARDLAAVDWAATPLGPVQAWPRSLTTVVRMIIDSRFSMWMAWGPELTFFCNEAYRRDTLRAKYPWALGRPAHEVWAEIWPDIGPRIERVLSTGEATWDEGLLLFLERSGYPEETYHTFSYSPLTGDDGAVAGMLCVVTEDTERIVGSRRMDTLRELGAELARAGTEADLLAAAGRELQTAPHSIPFALVYLFDGPGSAARLAVCSGAAVGDPVAPPLLEYDAPDCPWPVAPVAAGRAVTVEDLSARFPRLPTGAWDEPPLRALAVPLQRPGQPRPYGFLIVGLNRYRPLDAAYRGFVDLLAGQIAAGLTRARAYDAERERAAQLAELDRAKTTFFTNISHELRTPLTLLIGPAEDALTDRAAPLPAAQRARVEVIARNGERLLKLVNTLLDFSRLESGRARALFEPVDLARYTGELASMFESAIRRAGLELHLDCPPLPAPVHVDREMWAKIVLNLLSNALKATFEGAITVSVTTEDSAEPTGPGAPGAAVLRVADTGIGISAEEQEHLFERFHRVAGAALRTHEGSGIGLALVAELAELHGAAVSVESALGRGSTFTVRVPFGTAHLPDEQVAGEARADAPTAVQYGVGYVAEAARWIDADLPHGAPDGSAPGSAVAGQDGRDPRPRILLADDTPDMRQYVAGLLATDYAVETAVDGEQALALARARPPDLVLTDVMMPRLDGFGLLAALRADPVTMHIPVVMLSARAGDEATVQGLEAGADDYLVKPFDARELSARVRSNLELDRVRRVAAELRRNRELLDQAERLAQVGSWEIDLATNAIRASPEYYRILGVAEQDVAAHGLGGALERLYPEDAARASRAIEQAIADGTPIGLDVRLRDPSGDRVLRSIGVIERDPAGRPAVLRGSLQDVSAQRRAEREIAAAAAEREAAAREHRIAEELQRSLLPVVDEVTEGLQVAAFYRAGVEGTQVGGDWYDVIALSDRQVALVIGDVMGRGVRAASVMGQLRATARAYARIGLPPAQVLNLLDAAVQDLGEAMIVTCVYAVHDEAAGVLTYANAGHLPALLVDADGSTRLLPAGGPPLGTGSGAPVEGTVPFPPGATLALYTDGLVERRGTDIDSGIETLAEVLASPQMRGLPLSRLPGAVVPQLVPGGPDDDVALLVARAAGAAEGLHGRSERAAQQIRSVIDQSDGAVRAARLTADRALASWGLGRLADDVLVVVSELVTNALTHAGPPIEICLRRVFDAELDRRPGVCIEVSDGSPTPPTLQQLALEADHGRGLQIVAALSARWGSSPTAEGKRVWSKLYLDPR